MLKNCPDPVDVQDLQFKLQCRLKIFNNKELNVFKSSSLLTCASRYGLLFVGSNSSNLQVIQMKCVENYSPKDKDVSNYPRRLINLPSPPKHISVNCDNTILAVVIERDMCATVIFYEILSFLKQNVIVIKEARLSTIPGVYVTEINWNPALPTLFTACKSDGSLGVFEIQGNSININELPAAAEATSFCWSPKGKQIAVGSRNGKITQYKPDLKAVKAINEPPLEGSHSLISLQWVSNYQFIGIYQSAGPECSAKLLVVDAPKTGEMTYTNYEDVCYSGNNRPPQFYMTFQQHWNILLVASANSTELGVLANTGDTWTQWIISDSARAELPLSTDHQETLPIGLTLDISSTTPFPWNESFIPPCPYLLILSHEGVLCIFNVVNLKEGIPSICTPPDSISDISGISQFVVPDIATTVQKNVSVTTDAKEPTFAFALTQNTPSTQSVSMGTKVLTQPQPTYATSTSLYGVKTNETKNLFGGQAILTPINPQQPTSQASIFGGQTLITPINKLPVTTLGSTIAPSDKYASIFAAVSTPISTPVTIQTKPIVISTPTATKSEQLVHKDIAQSKPTPSSGTPTDSKMTVGLKVKGEKDALLAHMIRDECLSLETELRKILHQGKFSKIDVGTEDEKLDLITKIESLQEFVKEIVDISIGENAEIHYLKQNLIQCWAWFEEARSRYNSSKDKTLSLLLKSQPLDSATEKRQQDITKLMYYIETQISQASKALDEQWDNFQDYAKKTHRTKMPTMETIFQTMVRQNAVLQKQSYILKDIANRLKSKSPKGPSLLLALENTDDLEDNLKHLHLNHPQDIHRMQYERVLRRMKNLSTSKTNKLRDLLKTREVQHVTVVKPQLSSSVVLQSPESKSKRLLSNLLTLSTQVSPVAKTNALPRQLNFVHSTPIRDPLVDAKPTEAPPNTPQIDTKTFSFKKVEKGSSTALVTTAINFAQPTKGTSVFSNLAQNTTNQPTLPTHSLSAFVPTTQITFSAGSSGKALSFTPAITTSTTVLKTDSTGAESAIPAFSLGGSTPPLSKFGMAATPKITSLVTSASAPKSITPTTKTTLPQFNFGNSISITPVTMPKITDSSKLTTTDVATSKSAFSFGGTSIFGSKIEPSTSNKSETIPPVSNLSLFSNLPQSSKSVFGSASASSFSFGAASGTSIPSAFTPVTTSIASPATTIPTTSVNIATSKPEAFVTTTQFGDAIITTNIASTSTTTPVSLFRNTDASTKPQSFFDTSITASLPTSSPAPTSSNSLFGNLTVVTKPSAVFTSTPITSQYNNSLSTSLVTSSVTPTVSSSFSMPTKTSVDTVESSKPSTSNVNSVFASSVTSTNDTTQSMSIFGTSINTTKPSLFGASTTETKIFDMSTLSPKSAQPSVFNNTSTASHPSIFGTSLPATTTTSIFGGIVTTQSSIFGTPGSTTTATGSIFAQTTTNQSPLFVKPTSPVTTSSIFGNTPNTTSVFGVSSVTKTSTSPFDTKQASSFGSTTATQSSIFETAVPVTTTSSIFGGTTTTQSSICDTPISSATTKPSMFGSGQPSVFGSTAPVSTQQSSIFGGVTNTNQTSIFGAVSSTPPSLFGGTSSTTKPSVFGATTSASVSQPSMFTTTSVPSTQTSPFAANTVASPFGSSFNAVAAATSSSPFGQSTPIFGVPKTTEGPFGSTFGSSSVFGSTPATAASAFGQPVTFGSNSQSVFGTPTTSTNVFGAAAPSPTFGAVSSSANVFGAPSSSSSFSFAGTTNNAANTGSFGFGGLNVGNTATTTGSIFSSGSAFGGATSQANPFGRTTEQKSPFAGSSNIFGSPAASTSSSVFGSGSGSVFGTNTQTGFGTSTFGAPSTFGQQSTFGQSSFGNTSFGSTPGPFSGSGGGVGQTGFGSPTTFQKPSGFGSSPVFGGSPQPAFGAAPSFGGAPAFGSTPSFGSPNKVFGASTSPGFGSATTGNAGFGNLANQNTIGFGNLAQQAASSNTSPFSGSSSFSSWR